MAKGGGKGGAIPQIHLTRDEIERYNESVAIVLGEAVSEFSNFNGYIDTDDWGLVRKRKQMRVYRSLQPNDDPRVTLMVGTGLIPGTLEDVMDGVYCDTTSDLRAVKTLLKYKFLDGAVLNVTKKRSPEAPFDFAGIKWFAAKAPWGLVQHRDLLTYEVGVRESCCCGAMSDLTRSLDRVIPCVAHGNCHGRQRQRARVPCLAVHRSS